MTAASDDDMVPPRTGSDTNCQGVSAPRPHPSSLRPLRRFPPPHAAAAPAGGRRPLPSPRPPPSSPLPSTAAAAAFAAASRLLFLLSPSSLLPAEEREEEGKFTANFSWRDVVNESPIEEVKLTVPTTDDCTLPVLTFRTWFLGVATCIILTTISTFTSFRQNPIMFPMLTIQLLILPAGKLMETILPAKNIRIPGTKWQFSLNPGPFNIKEHVVISTFATSAGGSTSAIDIMATVKAFFKTTIHPLASFLLILTTNVFGIGFVGFFMKLLVDSPHMWWPEVLPSVAFFRALHEKEVKSGRNLTRLQFFFLASVLSFSYYVVPGYFFLQYQHFHLFAGYGSTQSQLNNLVLVLMVLALDPLLLIGIQLSASLAVLL
uniref:Uncharacterized protein n=1 Tax=Ananas comosus var. bracteatus TaxID=296719 RepID=A0A6V7P8V9_ANACO|nr:unnamed protein product [Ananas comosus var. bracteatus]